MSDSPGRNPEWRAGALSPELLVTILGEMGEGVVVQASSGEIIANNRAAEQILGLTGDQLRGRTSMDPEWHAIKEDGSPFPGEEHPAMVTLATGESLNDVLMGVSRPDGEYRWIQISSRLIEDGERMVIATFTDVTRLREMEASVALERSVNEALIRSANEQELLDVVVRIPVELGAYALVWIGFLGDDGFIKPVAAAGPKAHMTWDGPSFPNPDRVRGPGTRVASGEDVLVIDDLYTNPAVEPWRQAFIDAEVTVGGFFPVHRGGLQGVLSVFSEEPLEEREVSLLTRLAENLGYGIHAFRSAVAVAEARDALAREISNKDEFMASVAHELRTPLATIFGISHEASDRWDDFEPDELRELAHMVRQQSADLTHLIDDFLVLARRDTDVRVRPELLDLRVEAATVAEEFDGVEIGEGVCSIVGDPIRVRQIIRNLVSNARRHGEPPFLLRFPDSTSLEMVDHGPGVPEGRAEEIFRPYSRTADTDRVPMSVGLGLTISRHLAQLMGGDVTYRRDGETTVFRLELPAHG